MDDHAKRFREWGALDGRQEIVSPETVLPEDDLVYFLLERFADWICRRSTSTTPRGV